MKDEDFINYCMVMHSMSPEQKLIYLKELVDSMQKNYEKPGFIVTSQEELDQKLEQRLLKLTKMGLNDSDLFINPIQDKINRLPNYE